jgi:hypothetical protein
MLLESLLALLPVCDVGSQNGLGSSQMIASYDVKITKLDASCNVWLFSSLSKNENDCRLVHQMAMMSLQQQIQQQWCFYCICLLLQCKIGSDSGLEKRWEDIGGWFHVDVAVELSVMCGNEQMKAVCAHVHLENAYFTYLRVSVWTWAHMCTMCVSLTCALSKTSLLVKVVGLMEVGVAYDQLRLFGTWSR